MCAPTHVLDLRSYTYVESMMSTYSMPRLYTCIRSNNMLPARCRAYQIYYDSAYASVIQHANGNWFLCRSIMIEDQQMEVRFIAFAEGWLIYYAYRNDVWIGLDWLMSIVVIEVDVDADVEGRWLMLVDVT